MDLSAFGVVDRFMFAEVGVDRKVMGYDPCQQTIQNIFPGMFRIGFLHCCIAGFALGYLCSQLFVKLVG